MLYDLRAKLSEVSSAAKKRQADAAAREASLEESLQLAQQRLAEEVSLLRFNVREEIGARNWNLEPLAP